MGGFLLIKKEKNRRAEDIEELYREPINVFSKKGLSLNKKIIRDEFVIYLFHKYSFNVENLLELENNDFVISTGTCIYNKKKGSAALKEIYENFTAEGDFLSKVYGNYCLIISYKGSLFITNDFVGLYHVYCDKSKSVISSSFLAILNSLKEKSLSSQEFYEYVFTEAFYADRTIFKEIKLLDSKSTWQLIPKLFNIPKNIQSSDLDMNGSFNEEVERVSSSLIEYFDMLKTVFSNDICSALTGGYDTRLMLALMRKVGIAPYLYVYGDDNSQDVKIAKTIAKGENLTIDHINKGEYPKVKPNHFSQLTGKQFYLYDGLGITGIFDNGSDMVTRIERSARAQLQLNGGAGAIYRNFWKLPNKNFHIRTFLKSKYNSIDYSICTDSFDKSVFFSKFEEKIKLILNTDQDRITRQQVEMLIPFLRSKYWLGMNNSINSQFAYALIPYAEQRFFIQCFNIPLKYKNFGCFEAALIKFIDPDLAKYPSAYGINFYDKIKFRTKIIELIKIHTPIFLRTFIRRNKLHIRSPLSKRVRNDNLPFYLQSDYLKEIFNSRQLKVSQYININKINDPYILSRALSIELLISDKF